MPEYHEIDWDRAACRGEVYTDLFYLVEETRSILQYEYINALRSICASCPIWKSCLSYAMEHESYGLWGGMTSIERLSMRDPRRYPNQRKRAIADLERYGIYLDMIWECL